jgi:hypothetical protein
VRAWVQLIYLQSLHGRLSVSDQVTIDLLLLTQTFSSSHDARKLSAFVLVWYSRVIYLVRTWHCSYDWSESLLAKVITRYSGDDDYVLCFLLLATIFPWRVLHHQVVLQTLQQEPTF